MPKLSTNLLTLHEQAIYYHLPTWSAKQRNEYFTFNPDEIKALKQYPPTSAIYFALTLAYFKAKQRLFDFTADEVVSDIEHVQQRYLAHIATPIALPRVAKTKTRIETTVLKLCGYKRCHGETLKALKKRLAEVAPRYPKQRALCKALLDICKHDKIALPSMTTLERLVRELWQQEQQRLHRAYYRHTHKSQRQTVLSLLDKSDQTYIIAELKQELKHFRIAELEKALSQQDLLEPVFFIAQHVIPKLKIPANTIDYYADLIDYYKGTRLANLDQKSVQIYLLCYCFIRFQKLNDLLLEGFKKRCHDYYISFQRAAEQSATQHLEKIKAIRKSVSDMLLAIKAVKKNNIPKTTLFSYVPEDKLVETAHLLIDESLDPEAVFWQEVDKQHASIRLNLRPLFLKLALVIERHEALSDAIAYLRENIDKKIPSPLPETIRHWLSDAVKPYIVADDTLNFQRLEFWIYYQLSMQLKTNKLTLKYTLKYKPFDDDLMPKPQWKKKKKTILSSLPYSALRSKPKQLLQTAEKHNRELYQKVNHAIINGDNPEIIITPDQQGQNHWRLRPLVEENSPLDSLFATFPKCSIVDILRFVNQQLRFTRLFDAITPRGAKHDNTDEYILAIILANALRLGTHGMGDISDLNSHSLLSVEKSCIRMETLTAALNCIYDAANQLPIFKKWNIASLYHGNMDGMKLPTQFSHSKARNSPKYFGLGIGVSSYNMVLNHFPMAGTIIGANEYEGHFAFELCQFQKISQRSLDIVSTDKHGVNSLNFLLFYLIDLLFAPRIPKPHDEVFWGFGAPNQYKDYIIRPTKFMKTANVIDNWDPMQHCVASMLTGDTNASVLIQKLASSRYHSPTKRGFVHYNNILKSNFLLQYIHDLDFRHAIERALNRGEAFNRLYQAIALLNKGQLRGQHEIDMMIWDACTRLLAAVILYYNSVILNTLYENATDSQMKEWLLRVSPTAWAHINLLGHYQFLTGGLLNLEQWIKQWPWEQQVQTG